MKGIGASSGVTLAKAFVWINCIKETGVPSYRVEDTSAELARLAAAAAEAERQIVSLMDRTRAENGSECADIFEFQMILLSDKDFLPCVQRYILEQRINAEQAVSWVMAEWVDRLAALDNDYMRERVADVKDVFTRVQSLLLDTARSSLSELSEEVIVVAAEMAPSELMDADPRFVKGLLMEAGGTTSHTVLIAKSLGIPVIVGLQGISGLAVPGQNILMDGQSGMVDLAPDLDALRAFQAQSRVQAAEEEKDESYRLREAVTCEGRRVKVFGNIATGTEAGRVVESGGDGVGLFRSELVFMKFNRVPTAEEQRDLYADAADRLQGRAMIIRTLDAGGDKELPFLGTEREDNPFLGYRAIRYCLDNRDVFKAQLSAILQVGALYEGISVMFPMIATLEELTQAKALLAETQNDLDVKGVMRHPNMRVGMMMEVPSAALMAPIFAREVDFFSIGTNDLTQYLFAADRTNARVSRLGSPFHPQLLRLVEHIVTAAHDAGIEADICGNAGEDPLLLPLWLCLGIDAVSVSPASIPRVKRIICELDMGKAREVCRAALSLNRAGDVEALLQKNFSHIGR